MDPWKDGGEEVFGRIDLRIGTIRNIRIIGYLKTRSSGLGQS